MKYSHSFEASAEFITKLRDKNTPSSLFHDIEVTHGYSEDLFEDFKTELEEDEQGLVALLNQYDHKFYIGEVQEETITITNGTFNTDGTGKLWVDYEVYYHFGCSDINRTDDESMIIDVKIDIAKGIITLIGEDEPERIPDEY